MATALAMPRKAACDGAGDRPVELLCGSSIRPFPEDSGDMRTAETLPAGAEYLSDGKAYRHRTRR
jgi:hypothetical protein